MATPERGEPRRRSTRTRDPAGPARLFVVQGEDIGRKYLIEERATLGRGEGVTIELDDVDVSRTHAEIRRTSEGEFVIADLGSRNGTYVNELPVSEQVLDVGDKIRLGPHVTLVFTRFDPIEQAVQQRQRLEALGQLTAGIAHDFNNMVGALVATVDFLHGMPAETTLSDPDARECLQDLGTATTRAAALTQSLLHFVKGDGASFGPVDVGAVCVELAAVLRRTLPRGISVEQHVEPRLTIRANPTDLYQVLMNLCVNARDAMGQSGRLTIRVERAVEPPAAAPRASIRLSVSDTGTGMDEATSQRIFEPFFTTKARGAGFGLGLSTVRDIVRAHGGHLTVDTQLGRGTTFAAYFPAARVGLPRRHRKTGAVDARIRGRGETVLVVDDEAVVRRSMRRLLRQAGYSVVDASDGAAAVRLFSAGRESTIDLVLLDIDMPGLSGAETLVALREAAPGLPALFMTGHRPGPLVAKTPCIPKPCSAEELSMAVATALIGFDGDDEEPNTASFVLEDPPEPTT